MAPIIRRRIRRSSAMWRKKGKEWMTVSHLHNMPNSLPLCVLGTWNYMRPLSCTPMYGGGVCFSISSHPIPFHPSTCTDFYIILRRWVLNACRESTLVSLICFRRVTKQPKNNRWCGVVEGRWRRVELHYTNNRCQVSVGSISLSTIEVITA